MAYRQILIPLDGSKLSEQALGQLAHIAAPGAAIQLLSVMAEDAASEVNALSRSMAAGHDGSIGWPPIAGVKDPHAADARKEYLNQVKEWLEAAEYEVRVSIREGNIIDAILEAAKVNEVIVIASYQKSAAISHIVGSVAEAITRQSAIPVMIVPGQRDK